MTAATLTRVLPVKPLVIDRHRAATARHALAAARLTDLSGRGAVVASARANLAEHDPAVRTAIATAAELLPDAITVAQETAAEALEARTAARDALLPLGNAQPNSTIWNARAAITAALERQSATQREVSDLRERHEVTKRRLEAGFISDGAELVARRGELELSEPRLRSAEAAAQEATRAHQAAKQRELELVTQVHAWRRSVVDSDDPDEVERAAAAIWSVLAPMPA